MQDRQDIDALLMGALYGELSPDESTRLEAHLSAHPQDRMALDGLTQARQAIRDSHVLVLQAEPPAAITALILQEAARRAPAPRAARAGVLARFFSSFAALSRHPAMAGAMVIVLVAGVAGTLYLRGKDQMVEQEVSVSGRASPPPAVTAPAMEPTAGDDTGYRVDLATKEAVSDEAEGKDQAFGENQKLGDNRMERKGAEGQAAATRDGLVDQLRDPGDAYADKVDKARKVSKKPPARGIVVTTPEPTIKPTDSSPPALDIATDDGGFDKEAAAPVTLSDRSSTNTTDMSIGGRAAESDRQRVQSQGKLAVPPPAPPAEAVAAPSAPVTGSVGAGGGAPGKKVDVAKPKAGKADAPADVAKKNDDAAKALHTRLVGLVKANKCSEASRVGADLHARYPDYYAAEVRNDRNVKACRSYIETEQKRRSMQNMKSRSANDSYEPMPSADVNK